MVPALIRIDAADDPRVADYAALTDARLRKRYEHQRGVLIAEGPNPVRELVESAYPVRSLLLAEERVEQMSALVERVEAPIYVVERQLLYDIVRFKLHQGVIACGQRLPRPDPTSLLASANRIAILEGLNDHANLGTLFRSARGLGVDAMLLSTGCADPLYRRSVRTSMGHVLHVPHTVIASTVEAIDLVHRAGFLTVALTPDPAAMDLKNLTVSPSDRVAVLVGAEGPGLSTDALRGAHRQVRIPMSGGVDSLNVATAASIAFHHLSLSDHGR